MNGVSPIVPTSWIVTMLGWFSADSVRASARNCSSRAGSVCVSADENLQRDAAAELLVDRLVDHAHAAAVDHALDAVA